MAQITVTGILKDMDGDFPSSGTVSFAQSGMFIDSAGAIIPATTETANVSAIDGSFSMTLASTTDGIPSNISYAVLFSGVIEGAVVTQALGSIQLAPSPASVLLKDLIIAGIGGGTAVTPTIAAADVSLTLKETDQALPAGMWRLRVQGDILTLEKNTAVAGDFSTLAELYRFTSTNALFSTTAQIPRLGLGAPADSTTQLLISGNSGTLPGQVNNDYIHVVGKDNDYAEILIDTFGKQGLYYSRRANGTNASKTALLINDIMFQISSRGYGATGYCTGGRAEMTGCAAENWSDTAQGTYLRWHITPKTTVLLTEAMRLTDNACLGIGGAVNNGSLPTGSPDTKLTVMNNPVLPALIDTGLLAHYVAKDSDFSGIQFDLFAANPYGLIFRRANNTAASPSALANADVITVIQARGYGATAYSGNRAFISMDAAQAWTDANQGTKIRFGVTPLNSTAIAEALAITNLAVTPGLTDNAEDFGSTSFRWKDGFFGGTLRFGTYTATPGTITGYITITDAGGTTRKLAVTT